MYGKRGRKDDEEPSRRPRKDNVESLAQKARASLAKRRKASESAASESTEGRGGLNVDIHPLLRGIGVSQPLPKNHNPLKQNVRKWFDPLALNPYLNQGGLGRRSKQLQFNEHGKYIAEGNKLREETRAKIEEKKIQQEKQSLGLLPDENLGEHLWEVPNPPKIEWWDQPYLKKATYDQDFNEEDLVLDNEDFPVSIYIQHPVLLAPTNEKHQLSRPEKGLYLTKKEMKRIRKNERQEKLKEKQDRIKLGLDPPPPPKVKLSNLMSVLTNEAIKDPTAVEMRVKQEVEERLQKHLAENEARKLTKDRKHEKIFHQQERDLQQGYYTTVYRVDQLVNPSHIFKVDTNAKQLGLLGICLLNPRFSIVIVVGGQKGIKFYRKLMTKRIKWTEDPPKKSGEDDGEPYQPRDLSGNRCQIVWDGQVKDLVFKKWSIMRSQNDEEALDVLNRFGLENYWRESIALD